ncbi:MAG: putative toxin, partial [Acidobacteriota bacterium]
TARFLSVDPARESVDLQRPQTWNRYTYAFNNPVTLVDPDGRAAETPWDVANVAIGVGSLMANIAAGNVPGAVLDAGGIALDLAATAAPGVPGGASASIKAARLAKNARFGKAFEKAVLNAVDLSKNTKKIDIPFGEKALRIPDGVARGVLLEVKGVQNLYLTSQVRDFLRKASEDNLTVVIAVTEKTKISRKFNELLEEGKVVIVRFKAE